MGHAGQSASFSIRELAERAKREGAYDLAQGIIDTAPPEILIQTLRSLPLELYSSYNNKRGVQEYREAIQLLLQNRRWNVELPQLMATAGVMGGIASSLLADLLPGATVLLVEPFFVYHKSLLDFLGFKSISFPAPLDAAPDWSALSDRLAQDDVDALLLVNPANPTGQSIPADQLRHFSALAKEKNKLFIIDEIYREFVWEEKIPDDSLYAYLDLTNTTILRSFSKTLAIPGWRIGFAITSPDRMERMAARHDALYIGGSTIAQHALARTLTDNLDEINRYVENLRIQLQANHRLLESAFIDYGMEPLPVPGTYYMLIKHNRQSDIEAMEELIARKVVTTPVNILYADQSKDTGYIRIHFAVSLKTAQAVADILRS